MEQRMSNSEAEELWRRIKAEMAAAAAAAGSNSGSHPAAIRIKVPESLRPLWEALRSGLPDGYSLHVFGPSGFWTLAPLRYAAKFDPFLSLDCAPTPSTLAQSKERKGSNFAIWQPCHQALGRGRRRCRGKSTRRRGEPTRRRKYSPVIPVTGQFS